MRHAISARRAAAAFLCSILFVQPALPAPVQYQYDALGRVISVNYPNGQQITYTYDAAGNRTQTVTAATTGNRPPDAVDDPKPWLDGTGTLTFDPRTNDTDPEANAITVVGAGAAQWGTASYTSTSLSYVAPNAHIVEKDSFNYTIQDTAGGRDTAVVTVDLGNLPPVPTPDALTVPPNVPTTFDPRANDTDPGGDAFTVTGVGVPAHGTAAFTAASVTYTPAGGYIGSDTFTYTVTDEDGGSATGTVNATVSGVNHPPVANDDLYTAYVGGGGSGYKNVCTNDSDPDVDPLTIISITQPSRGSANFVGCTVNYGVLTGNSGTTSFTYTISDGRGGTATATVNVNIIKLGP